jgi:UDP-N-acetylglucosamine 2-epimerase (non-hydrolysing)
MAPVILAMRQEAMFGVRVLVTAQHRDLLDQILAGFGIKPDIDLDIMRPDQSLATLTARLLLGLDGVLQAETPDLVLAQGDTTTVMTAALACYYLNVPFGHVEAGLRTGDIWKPFPEEANRIIAGRLARWHFAPTATSKQNLLREGVEDQAIVVTGNTVIDSLLYTAARDIALDIDLDPAKRLLLVTAHRRESIGEPFRDICRALKVLVERNTGIEVLFPVHPNPNVHKVAYEMLGSCPSIHLCAPLDYGPFVAAMKRAYLIITDSGGIQEEAPALGKPVLVLRNETERPEAVESGAVKLVGTNPDSIVAAAQRLLDDDAAYCGMVNGMSPYGDGKAADRIVEALKGQFSLPSRVVP